MLDQPLIIAPQFINESEVTGPIPDNVLYWNGGRFWRNGSGNTSSNTRTARVRTFDALDWLLEYLCADDRFPNLKQIVIVGHSGGARIVNRYAASSPFREDIADQRNIDVKHICMNPGSYLYFSDRRRVPGVGHSGYGMMTSESGIREIVGPFGSSPSRIPTPISPQPVPIPSTPGTRPVSTLPRPR